jgi:hypothetical protein
MVRRKIKTGAAVTGVDRRAARIARTRNDIGWSNPAAMR